MEFPRHEFLSRSILPKNQDIGISLRNFLNCSQHLMHRRRPSDESMKAIVKIFAQLLLPGTKLFYFAARLPYRHRRRECGQQLFVLPGLEDEIGCARFDRTDGHIDVSECRDENDDHERVDLQNPIQPVESLLTAADVARKIHVKEYDVVAVFLQQVRNQGGVFLGVNIDGMLLEEQLCRQENIPVIVYDQYFSQFFDHERMA